MTTRQINRVLWTAASALLAAAAGSIVLALAWPLGVAEPPSDFRLPAGPARAASRPADEPASEALAKVWETPLRRPLGDPPPATAAAAIAPPPRTPPIVLVGTIGNSLALVRLENGTTQIVAAGETVTGVEVLTIRPAHIDVRFNGAVVTLEKVSDAPPPPPG